MMKEIHFITSNKGKINALRQALEVEGLSEISVVAQNLNLCEPQFNTVEEVSAYKARQAHQILQKPVLVEDGGFCLEGLNGFPGVYTKYILETIGIEGILKLLSGCPNRRAKFVSCASYIDENGELFQFDRKGGEFAISEKIVEIDSPYAWSELWKIIFLPTFGKNLCQMGKEEIDDYMHGNQVEGSVQQFAKWCAGKVEKASLTD